METHGVKHHYLHQANQQSNHHHNSLPSPQPFGYGSNQNGNQTTSGKISFESSTAFPLLLSSIESGCHNFNAPFSRTKTFSSVNNATGNVNHNTSSHYSHNSNTFQQFNVAGAGKHKQESSNSNGGVKATPKPKSAATPNLITSSGRQQASATFGHSSANGHLQSKSSQQPLTAEAAAPTSTPSLPFKKHLLARETLNNNGTLNRSRASPNKENKTATLSNATTVSASAPSDLKRPTIKSPIPRIALPSGTLYPKHTVSNSANSSKHNHCDDHHLILDGVGVSVPSEQNNHLPTHHIPHDNTHSAFSQPKPFKFFKEKAKDKQQLHKNSSVNGASSSVSKAKLSSSEPKVKLGSNGAFRKPAKGPSKSDKSNGFTERVNCSGVNFDVSSIGQNLSSWSSAKPFPNDATLSTSAHKATDDSLSAVKDSETKERIVDYCERVVDGFAFQCFFDLNSLECSLQEALSNGISVLNYSAKSGSTPLPSVETTEHLTSQESQSHLQLQPSLAPPLATRLTFRYRSPSPSDSSDAESDTSSINFFHRSLHSSSSRDKAPKKAPTNKKTSKSLNSCKNPHLMSKESKPKKTKYKSKKGLESDHNGDSDEEDFNDEEEMVTTKAGRRSTVKSFKCTHKHPKSKAACNRCLLDKKKKSLEQRRIGRIGKKAKAGLVGRKAKCKGNDKVKKSTGKSKTVKVSKKVRAKKVSDSEDSSNEDDSSSEDEENDSDSSDSGSDATQDDDDDIVEDNHIPTIADLIKCSNRREAVRKAAEKSALASVNARNKANRAAPAAPTEPVPSSLANLSSGPPATSSTDADLLNTKKAKQKKQPAKIKTASSLTGKTKRNATSANNKRSCSDSSSNEDGDDNDSSESEEEEMELTSPKRGRPEKKATKCPKRYKLAKNMEAEEESGQDSDSDEEETNKRKGRGQNRNTVAKVNKGKKVTKQTRSATKASKVKSKKLIESSDEDSSEGEEADDYSTDEDEEEDEEDGEIDHHLTDDADEQDEEEEDKQKETCKKPKNLKVVKKKEAKIVKKESTRDTKKSKQSAPNAKGAQKVRKNKKLCDDSKPDSSEHSDDNTEQSEEEGVSDTCSSKLTDQAEATAIGQSKSECNKTTKIKDHLSRKNSSDSAAHIKDVYTFELSPAEVPSASSRLVLSSAHEHKARADSAKLDGIEQSNADLTVSVSNTPTSSSMSTVKSSFSPQIVTNGPDCRENRPSCEPLRLEPYSQFEPSFGPNASLSSLSQLSQSIGGGTGPILLNHQSPTGKCPINIKEEHKDDASFRTLVSAKTSVVSEHLSTSQSYAAHINSANKSTHPHRLWSNASAGSLISSSSSSSSSPVPVHLSFGQCPPTPVNPASLASYFTPCLSGLSSTLYSQNQELIRRELDSRILASTVNDRNLLSSSLGIPPPSGPFAPIPTHMAFNHTAPSSLSAPTSSSSLLTPNSSSFIPSNSTPFYPISSNLDSNPFLPPVVPIGSLASTSTVSSHVSSVPVTCATTSQSSSNASSSSKPKPKLTEVKKGTWSSMHIRIAYDILKKQRDKSEHTTNTTSNISRPHAKSNKSPASSSSSTKTNDQSSTSKSSSSAKNTLNHIEPTNNNTPPNSARSSSVNTFNTNYPSRYGTPFAGNSSLSAPPILPGVPFPPTIPSPMHLPGFAPDIWPRPPIANSLPAPVPTSRSSNMFPDYYGSVNSASSALSAWAAGIKPPGESLTPTKSHSESQRHSSTQSSSHHSSKRKHEDESEYRREHSSSKHSSRNAHAHMNGDVRPEHSTLSKKLHNSHSSSSSKHHRPDSAASASRSVLENGDVRRGDSQSDSSKKSLFDSKIDTRPSIYGLTAPSVSAPPPPASTPFPPLYFGNSPFPMSDHQRYLDLLSMGPSLSSSNPYLSSRESADLASRSLWSFGMPPPPTSSVLSSPSPFMSDPFKSLQDISLRPGLVTPDRENLFARYSLLNSAGGGASIFDKLSKEQLEKFEMLQNQGKPNQAISTASSSKASHSSASSSSSHRVSLPPPPPPSAPPSTSLSSALPPSLPSTSFPYHPSYLSQLHHHLGTPGSSSYLLPQMSHPSFGAGNQMLNGMDSLSKLALTHPSSLGIPLGLSSESAPSSQFMLPPHFPNVPPQGPSMASYLKNNPASTAAFNYSSR